MIFRRIRRLLGLKPPYYEARQELYGAFYMGKLDRDSPFEGSGPAIEKIAGWDSWTEGPDVVELEMEAEALGMEVKTVGDFVRLLEIIDSRYEK